MLLLLFLGYWASAAVLSLPSLPVSVQHHPRIGRDVFFEFWVMLRTELEKGQRRPLGCLESLSCFFFPWRRDVGFISFPDRPGPPCLHLHLSFLFGGCGLPPLPAPLRKLGGAPEASGHCCLCSPPAGLRTNACNDIGPSASGDLLHPFLSKAQSCQVPVRLSRTPQGLWSLAYRGGCHYFLNTLYFFFLEQFWSTTKLSVRCRDFPSPWLQHPRGLPWCQHPVPEWCVCHS
ncbi:uncharacterized protein LOC129049586 [Pongo abelii]|uniref:uncharacterized protein LOC129049586 n=1 Tax=Pongo abelii TaxID=9601 RepID=UPI0023E7971A|nr:uncharacterized protein LOC129049586 [Pongo abelii]